MTAISEVSICNQALIALGGKTISALTENSKNARICNALYESVRDYVLTDHPWNFAQERVALATLASTPVWTDDNMTIMYQKPADCLKINYVNIGSATVKIEEDKILSDTSGLKIKYTQRMTDPMKFFPKFIEALVARLAAEMAYAVTSSKTLGTALFEIYYSKKLPQAIATDSQQGTPISAAQDEWLLSRIQGATAISGNTGDNVWWPLGE